MGVDPITLVPSPPPPRRVAAAPPAGLLQCFPLGEPPRLRFFALPAGKTVVTDQLAPSSFGAPSGCGGGFQRMGRRSSSSAFG